ncbi:acetyl ornithine aminotransferase family protein [Bryobacter aggregatus]|uniref:acetyl ornithine aminotransferase family protein n=1 Tax=Bryobacter aggregatus TaxID=360054 RepID=UPI00055AF5B0|nr:acetyl ornithine aminotransferase family protein [Bryobacter aggregatus]
MSNPTLVRPDLPHLVTPLPGPKSAQLIARDNAVLSPSYTRSYPLTVAHAQGAMIEDLDGNRFLDCNAGIAVCATGHCHPKVIAAIQAQATKFLHYSGTDFYYENMVTLAEKLQSLAPGAGPRRVYFGNSGAEAIEASLKIARYHTGRERFIAFFGAFHGRTMGALSLTGSKSIQKRGFGSLLFGVTHIPYANCYRCSYGKQVETCAVECVKVIEDQLIRHILPADDIAGIVVEPVQGEGGYVVPPQKFVDELQAVASRHGIPIIWDEVQSGMGRTGKMFATEHFKVDPQILAIAKGIASGLPLSAVVTRPEWMTWKPGAHASTFGGNPVAIASSLVTIELLETELLRNAEQVGGYMLDRMREWPHRFRHVGRVQGLGLMIGFELVKDQQGRERFPELRDRLEQMAFQRGLLILGCGPNSIRLCPPLVFSRDQATFCLDTLEACLQQSQESSM